MLDLIEDYCIHRGWKYVRLDGGVHPVKRNVVIEAFSRKGLLSVDYLSFTPLFNSFLLFSVPV